MVMSVPWLNYPLTIEALTGGGGAEINLLVPQKSKICFPGFPSCSPIFFIFAGIILDGPNPFCEKVLLLLENGLYFWLGPI